MSVERRKYPRTKPPADFTVFCSSADFSDAASTQFNLATKFVNVSAKGACVVTGGRLREGIALRIEIASLKTGARFKGKAVVRWSQTWHHEGREANVAGLELVDALEVRGEEMRFLASWVRGRAAFVDETRREHSRFIPPSATVGCFRGGLRALLGLSGNVARHLVDLSEGGLQLDCTEKLEPGQKVKVRLEFKTPAAIVEGEGEVRWCKRNTLVLEPHWMTGIKFTRLSSDGQENLKNLAKLFAISGGSRPVDDGPPPDLV